MQRRAFIQLSSYTALAIAAFQLNGCKPDPAKLAMSKPYFLLQFVEEGDIRKAGEDYINKVPKEDNQEAILQSLMEGLSGDAGDMTSLENLLNKKIHDDFDKGNTIIVNGWVISVTEARQCALFALS